ncbi:MAG: tetratricopeptide repeat protein [Paracoccaceae bacterium]
MTETHAPSGESLSSTDKRDALARVLASPAFLDSPKLSEFLAYVVNQHLAGQDAQIKGKTIAMDVYGRAPDDSGGYNIVRVEARRLRRLLDEYNTGLGASDGVQLRMNPGGYVPSFAEYVDVENTTAPTSDEAPPATADRAWLRYALGGLAVAIVIVAGLAIQRAAPDVAPSPTTQLPDAKTRTALRDYSVSVLQAKDIAAEARDFYFPVFDARRQGIALEMFNYAIELAPNLPDGHAGAAQVLATLHMITPDPTKAHEFLEQAQRHAQIAIDLAPADPWTVAAQAWVLAQTGEIDIAASRASLAVDLAPKDGHVLDLVGVTSIFVGNPELAQSVSAPDRVRGGVASTGTRNIWGLANLMLYEDSKTIEAFASATDSGTVVSAPSLIFLAVAHDRTGNTSEAQRLVAELNRDWPNFPSDFVVRSVFAKNPSIAEEIMVRLKNLQ